MKIACGFLILSLAVALVSARPKKDQPLLDLGERVRLALAQQGITLEKLPQAKRNSTLKHARVGDIWSDCGKSFFLYEKAN